jgi:hypothetical protein
MAARNDPVDEMGPLLNDPHSVRRKKKVVNSKIHRSAGNPTTDIVLVYFCPCGIRHPASIRMLPKYIEGLGEVSADSTGHEIVLEHYFNQPCRLGTAVQRRRCPSQDFQLKSFHVHLNEQLLTLKSTRCHIVQGGKGHQSVPRIARLTPAWHKGRYATKSINASQATLPRQPKRKDFDT